MDMSSITAAIGGIKAALDIAKAMKDLQAGPALDTQLSELKQALAEAQSGLLSAQSDQFTLIDRVNTLEKEIADSEKWEAEKAKYTLHEVREGVFTYQSKKDANSVEPTHHLCTNCYDTTQMKSLLHAETLSVARAKTLFCPSCHLVIYTQGMWHPEHGVSRRRKGQ